MSTSDVFYETVVIDNGFKYVRVERGPARTEQAQESTDAFPPCDACHAPYGTHAAHCWREGVIR
jgi:hypothetical protein